MLPRALLAKFIQKSSTDLEILQRALHSRNKKALEFIAKGWNALKEVDRVIDYCEINDKRLIPFLRTAKENFELALEADNKNTHARYWLSTLHVKYHVPGANKAVGEALLVETAEMGDPDAQYALGCHLRVESYDLDFVRLLTEISCYLGNDYVHSDQQAFYYLEKAVDQHPGALYLLGAVYLTGISYGSLLLKGVEVPELLIKFSLKRGAVAHRRGRSKGSLAIDPVEMAREKFHIAAKAGCELGFKWLARLEEEEKREITEGH
ncbi:unnamed protein product [Sphenostylis stenocarpa]|uniref:Uncharacterized protein n=1 Tax=Sphenostylis stenocarpa TaxID=92480 RepID=A0AA86V7Y4_9FABA|nr:unnamed protein product [Sphenostylis stenocarpa]